jgi:hypothetical protein
MATLSRLAFAFGAPALFMATATGAVWLSTSRSDLVLGPSRPILFTPPSELAASADLDSAGPPAPPPNLNEPAPAWQAQARNALIPYSRAPLLSAARFSAAADAEAPAQALQCLTSAVYYEATGEPDAGKRAVAPKTICGVVDQGAPAPGCQFSFMCDGALARRPAPEAWRDAETIARAALNGYVETSVGAATHYHADYVVPVWARTMLKLTKLGRHIFYRWPGAAAYVTARPVEPAPSGGASDVAQQGAPNPLATSSLKPAGAPASAPPRSPPAGEGPHADAAVQAHAAAARPQAPAPAAAPIAAPLPSPKPTPTPEPPRRPTPPPSLRVGPL